MEQVYKENSQKELEQWKAEHQKQLEENAINQAKNELNQWKQTEEITIREDAIKRSHAVNVGKITEHLLPYLPEFNYNPKDTKFLGSPIDFIVFDGMDEDDIKNIIFVEVKTGKSQISSRERKIRNAIKNKKVEWVEIRSDKLLGNSSSNTAENMIETII